MFLKHNDRAVYPDLSTELRDADDWIVGILKNLDYYLDICTIAIEPLAGLLAIGIIFGIFSFRSQTPFQGRLKELFIFSVVLEWSPNCYFRNLCERGFCSLRYPCTNWSVSVRKVTSNFFLVFHCVHHR
jgi:hypothetical protein